MYDNPPPGHIPFQNVPEGTSTSGYIDYLIWFLEKYLPSFTKERKVNGDKNENDLTEQLYLHLTRMTKFNPENIEHPFVFQPEKSQKKKMQKGHPKRGDIAARLNTVNIDLEVIYVLEAKKLPTDKPNGKREKEYVSGEGGAIERFKKEAHGLDDAGNLLDRNGIIAYITEGEYANWFSLINTWISGLGWNNDEQLSKNYLDSIGKLTSTHTRISGSKVHLNHFWVYMK
jgi:hypothetical protein